MLSLSLAKGPYVVHAQRCYLITVHYTCVALFPHEGAPHGVRAALLVDAVPMRYIYRPSPDNSRWVFRSVSWLRLPCSGFPGF